MKVQQEAESDDALSPIPGFLGGVENALPLRGTRLLTTHKPMPAKKKKKK